MKRRLCWLIVALFLISGCVSGTDLRIQSYAQRLQYNKIVEELQPELDRDEKVSSINQFYLCAAYSEMKMYDKNLRCLDNLEKNIKGGDRSYLFFDLSVIPDMARAATYLDLGDSPKALKYAEEALKRLGDDLLLGRSITAMECAGVANGLMGNKENAEKYIQLINIQTWVSPILTFNKYMAMARIHMALKEYDKALADIQNPKANVTRSALTYAFGVDYSFQDLPKYFILTKCLFETGKINEARQGYDQILMHPQIKEVGGIYWIVLYDRARIALKDGNSDEAVTFMKRAVEVIEQQRASIDNDTGKIGFVGDKQDVYQLLVASLLAKGQVGEAFEYVERAKARALVDLLAKRQKFAYRGQTPEKTAALLTELAALETKSRSYDTDNVKDGKSAITRGIAIKAFDDLAKTAPELSSLVTVTSPKTAEIQKLLKPNETLLEYYAQGDDLFAFVLTNEGVRAAKLNGKGLTDSIRNLRQAVQDSKSKNYRSLSEDMYNRIMAPVLGESAKANLIIVPHGALHYLPFSMLSDGKDYLIDKVSIRILPSASVMPFLATRQQAPVKKMLILGNPDLGDPKMSLEGAEAEAKAIQNIWPDSVLLLRKQATKSVIMKTGDQFRMLHIAAHGVFNTEQPLESALLLSPDSENNGKLTAGELYATTLNADIVVLSACETGLGKISNGDDVVGLTRGFLYAGAGSIVASLWPVPDTETMFLMSNFYANLKGKMSPDAIRKAQLATKKKYPHPYFWAAFQWTGSGS